MNELTERALEIIEEYGQLTMEGIDDLKGLTRELEARGYDWNMSADTNYLLVTRED